jgi:hypothetical protein
MFFKRFFSAQCYTSIVIIVIWTLLLILILYFHITIKDVPDLPLSCMLYHDYRLLSLGILLLKVLEALFTLICGWFLTL